MSYYEKLEIERYLRNEIIIVLYDTSYYVGKLTDGLINEDWEEDGEPEALCLRTEKGLIELALKEIEMIAKVSDISWMKEAV